jgi:ribosome maturation protein Sdo1
MLSDREKFILHLVSMMTITKLSGTEHSEQLICQMMEDVRCNRCRSIAPEDVHELLEEINEELVSGELMFKHVMEDTIWSMTGERPNKNTNWDDMK